MSLKIWIELLLCGFLQKSSRGHEGIAADLPKIGINLDSGADLPIGAILWRLLDESLVDNPIVMHKDVSDVVEMNQQRHILWTSMVSQFLWINIVGLQD